MRGSGYRSRVCRHLRRSAAYRRIRRIGIRRVARRAAHRSRGVRGGRRFRGRGLWPTADQMAQAPAHVIRRTQTRSKRERRRSASAQPPSRAAPPNRARFAAARQRSGVRSNQSDAYRDRLSIPAAGAPGAEAARASRGCNSCARARTRPRASHSGCRERRARAAAVRNRTSGRLHPARNLCSRRGSRRRPLAIRSARPVTRLPTYAFAGVLLCIVGILIVPLPPFVLDVLLGVNIFASALVLLLSVTIEEPLEFSAFAPALLIATLFRLSLDVSATRLILTQGHEPGGVGAIIPAFGEFVVRGNLVVGLIVFAILITIQFIVIASGSQRVAEVAARFTLDAMPGKQMAIDADVHAGVLDADGARLKRELVQKEADFYGAMDGAGKFVKGDAIAALIIVALNLIGGVAVGMIYRGMSAGDALQTFALLSIGNALVTTLPAFLISTAMGMMVTRVAADGSLGSDLASQLFARPEILRVAGGLLLALALVPALPRPVFIVLGLCAFAGAHLAQKHKAMCAALEQHERDVAKRQAIRRPEMALGLVGVDAISIEFGSNLLQLLAPPLADALLDRIGEVRRALATEIGVVLPGVRLRDDLARDPDTYAIRVRDEIAGEGSLDLSRMLAVADEMALAQIGGEATREPVYGLPAKWIESASRDAALQRGALVFDPISVIGSHLAEAARAHAAMLLGRQELQTLLEHLRATVPTVVKEIGSDALPLSNVQKAFGLLLRERVWPRDPIAVLEAMIEASTLSRDPRELAEAARRVLVPAQLLRRNLDTLEPLLLDPQLERRLAESFAGGVAALDPGEALAIREQALRYAEETPPQKAAVVCTSAVRPMLADFLARSGLRLSVFSYSEVPAEIRLVPADVIKEGPVAA